MTEKLLEYYVGDEYIAGVWQGKYALKNKSGEYVEESPDDMHLRMAKEFWRIEQKYEYTDSDMKNLLSEFGQLWYKNMDIDDINQYLHDYKYIIPQGSIMTMLGNPYKIGSLSNCFVIPPPPDSYGGIMKTDERLVQLMKRRGGVGMNLNSLRYEDCAVSNAAGSSTGVPSFMHRYSNTTREVAQNGRRGALMLLLHCLHPDIFKFVKSKADLTKVTGANISTMLTDEFMEAAEAESDFICRFPVDYDISEFLEIGNEFGTIYYKLLPELDLEYNKIKEIKKGVSVMKIHAKELLDLIIEMAHSNGEPGLAFIDAIHNYSPDGVYHLYRAISCNPCGEQWMQAYDACRLLALNFFSIVVNPYTKKAKIDYTLLYEIAYLQQRLADDIVDLELEYVQRIIDKVEADPEDEDIKQTELDLWRKIKETATNSRRTGCGFTGLADMLAAIGLKYDEPKALEIIKRVMRKKMEAELDCTIDLAILHGPFKSWNPQLEFTYDDQFKILKGNNIFYQMLVDEFPKQVERMIVHGRRNVSWSTVAPTGTVSIVAKLIKYGNMSAGVEPIFFPWYFRNKKVNPGEGGTRVDFVDQNGDSWTTYPIVMGGFKEWYDINPQLFHENGEVKPLEDMVEHELLYILEQSPYYKACANDINWERRIEIQSIVQRYTTNAISSTLNLPNNTSKETVKEIYVRAWRSGLKGVTVYRDGCRTGVLVREEAKNIFGYKDSVKRPKSLDAQLHSVSVKGQTYGVVVGLIDANPYEVFAFTMDKDVKPCDGKLIKAKKGHYNFECNDIVIRDLQELAIHNDEQVLTRLISGMLRHGAKPQFVMEQIDKCELEVVSFGKAVSRILKKYVKEEEMINRNNCKDCGSGNIRMQEGCLTCNECGSSKCG